MKSPLVVTVEEPRSGARYTHVFKRSPVVLGRDPAACDLVIARFSISKVHAEITFDDGRITFRDLDSRNGSLVDDKPIPAETEVPVPLTSAVVVGGNLRLTFSRDPALKADDRMDPFAAGPVPQLRVAEPTEAYSGPPISALAAKLAPAAFPEPPPPDPGLSANAAIVPQAPLDDGATVAELSPRFDWPEAGPAPAKPLPPTALLPRRDEPAPSPSSETPANEQIAVGDVIAHYRVERLIARGGMGAIFEVSHTRASAKRFALKVLAREVLGHPEAEPRFLREAQAASRVTHPHVVTMVDFGKERGIPYLVLELLEGSDLADLIRRRPNLPVERIADIMLAVCSGVSAAHALGIIHRDLKPQNIFLQRTATGDTVPKVLDFGISKMRDPGTAGVATRGFSLLGTPNYLSPEQADATRPVDSRSDVYALGAILYECATGRPAHDGPTLFAVLRSIVEASYPSPSELRPELPMEFEAVIRRAMARRPDDRYQSVHELGRALLPFASPKRQAFWTDYYVDRRAIDGSGFDVMPISMSRHASQVPNSYAAGGTRLLSGSQPPPSPVQEPRSFPTGAALSPLPGSRSGSRSVPPVSTPVRSAQRRGPLVVAGIAAGLALASIAVYVVRPRLTTAPQTGAANQPPPVAAPSRPALPAPAPSAPQTQGSSTTNRPAAPQLAPPEVPQAAAPAQPSQTAAPETGGQRTRRRRALERNRNGVPILRP